MSDSVAANKTIAKNTIYLYIRLFATLIIGLYTSRIVLRELGVSDYGINNVVSSLLSLFTFIQGSLSSASSRFFAFSIGKGDVKYLNKVFCITVNIHIFFSILVFFVGESIGLWYIYNVLVVPPDRFFAACVVYQMSIIGSILSILVVPYNAMIIAQEHMNAFAYLGIVNILFKLLVAFILCITPIDKLITLSILGVCFSSLINILYVFYCKSRFRECNYSMMWDKLLVRDMMVYSGWSIVSYAPIVVAQLSNLMVNSFFGPVVNAARAVSLTVQQNVVAFVTNFQVALNPQIIKNFAANNMERVFELVNISQKISFSLMFMLFLPILTNVDYILSLWLVEVPIYTNSLVIIVAISSIFMSIVNPLGVIGEAANRLKLFNSISLPYYVISVMIVYIALYWGCDVILMFSIFTLFDVLYFLVAIRIVRFVCDLPYWNQLIFYLRTILVMIIGSLGSFYINKLLLEPFCGLVIKSILSLFLAILLVEFLVLSSKERSIMHNFIASKLKKFFVKRPCV